MLQEKKSIIIEFNQNFRTIVERREENQSLPHQKEIFMITSSKDFIIAMRELPI